jgi:hypothetical protein
VRLDDLPGLYNLAEVGLWCVLGVVVLIDGLRRAGPARGRCLVAALGLFAFAASDWAEWRTGNVWWRPWWLLAWKGACVAVLAGVGWLSWRRRTTA